MKEKLVSFLWKYYDTRAMGVAVLVITFQCSIVWQFKDDAVRAVAAQISPYVSVKINSGGLYPFLAYHLMNQINKMNGDDSEDFKGDPVIQLYSFYCAPSNDFVVFFIPTRPDARILQAACNRMLDLADDSVQG